MPEVRIDPIPASAGRATASRAGVNSAGPLATSTRRLLEDRIAATLLRLAAPTVVVMVIQAVVSAAEAILVGWLAPRWRWRSGPAPGDPWASIRRTTSTSRSPECRHMKGDVRCEP
jgi:hypothetical protein